MSNSPSLSRASTVSPNHQSAREASLAYVIPRHRPSSTAERFLREPDWPLRVAGHHALSVVSVLAPWLGLAFVALVLIPAWRMWSRHRLAAAGRWFELRLGEQVSRPNLETLTSTLAAGLPRPLLGAAPWVAFSLSASEDRARCDLFTSGGVAATQVCAAVEQALGCTAVEQSSPNLPSIEKPVRLRVAGLAPVGSRFLPLRVDHRIDPAGQLLAALRAQRNSEGGIVQLVLQAAPRSCRGRARSQANRLRAGRGLEQSTPLRGLQALASFLQGAIELVAAGSSRPTGPKTSQPIADPFSLERARAIDNKAARPLLAATLRVGAFADGWRRAGGRVGGLLAALGQFHDLGGLRKGFEPFGKRRLLACLPPVKPRLLLSSSEAAALIAVPEKSALAPLSFPEALSSRIAPVAQAPSRGLLLGHSDHSGFERDVRIEPMSLLQHAHLLGPTGRGKSTLLLNMSVEAMRAGMGGMVLDPTGELTGLILSRVPSGRIADVDLLDLGDTRHPPALNLLACSPADGDGHAQAICGIFARLFSRFWGPRTEDILRSALTTLLCGRGPADASPTLADVLTLLTDPSERSRYRASDPVALDVFWRQWQALSEQARMQALAPLSNKLRALLGNRALRNVLCQPSAPDLSERINTGRWLIVSLPQTLGEDASDLIGSVLLHRAWQAAQRLGPLAHSDRPPFLCLVDECHRFCHLPQGMATALAQARGYGVGMVLAHQNLAQLKDHELAEAVNANCQTKLCFGLGGADAKRMAVHFEPRLDARDLLHLGAHTIACRVLHDSHQLPAATATTEPPSRPTPGDAAGAIHDRARASATERSVVEKAIRERYERIEQPPPGRAAADEAPTDAGRGLLDRETMSAPFGAPHDAPYHGAPPPPATWHQHSDPEPEHDPDNEYLIPGRGEWP